MPDGRLRRSNAWTLDGSETSAAPVSPDGCVRLRSNAAGTAIEVSYDQAAYVTLSSSGGSDGTGTELQRTNGGGGFVKVTGSSVSAGAITLAETVTVIQDTTSGGVISYHYTNTNSGGNLAIVKGRGTSASPTKVLSGDSLGAFYFGGQYDTTVGHITPACGVYAEAAADFTGTTAAPSDLLLMTKTGGSAVVRVGLRVTSDRYVGIGLDIAHSDVTHQLTVIGDVKLNLGSDATGDIWYRAATTGTFTRLGTSGASSGNVLTLAGSPLLPTWAAATGGSPGGSGSEIQYRASSTTFGAVTGSSVSGGAISLTAGVTVTQDTTTGGVISYHFTNSSSGGNYAVAKGRGTAASPTKVLNGDTVGGFIFGGQYDTTVGHVTTVAGYYAEAAADFTGTSAAPCDLVMMTKANGSSAVHAGLRLTSDRLVGIGLDIAHTDVVGRLHVLETDTATVAAIIQTAASSTADALRLNASSTTKVKFTTTSGGAMNSVFGSAALATNATDGFVYLPTCAGTPSGAATAYTGTSAFVLDTTNSKVYFYYGAAWHDLTGAGVTPAGSGTELQYRNSSSFGAVTGSSVSGGAISLTAGITVTQDTTTGGVISYHFTNTSSGGNYAVAKGRGTTASPTKVLSGDTVGGFIFGGQYDTTVGHVTTVAGLYAEAAADFTGTTAAPCDLVMMAKPNGSAAVHVGLRVTSDQNVGIGYDISHADVTARLTVVGGALFTLTTAETFRITSDTVNGGVEGFAYGTSIAPLFALTRGRGTAASPTATQSGDSLGSFNWAGQYDTTVGHYTSAASIRADAQQTFAATNDKGADLVFNTSYTGSSAVHSGIRLQHNQYVLIAKDSAAGDAGAQLHVKGQDDSTVVSIFNTNTTSATADIVRFQHGGTTKFKLAAISGGAVNSVFGSAALATNATDGFIFAPTCAGAATGTPSTYTGTAPVVVDTTNFRIYVNIPGTGWKMAQLI